MKARKIKEDVYWMGSVDWDHRLFDALVPLPDGTNYNAYLIKGSEKTVLIDTVDPPMAKEFMGQLEGGKILFLSWAPMAGVAKSWILLPG